MIRNNLPVLFLAVSISQSYASWPQFSAPQKITPGTLQFPLNISEHFCRSFCPKTWYWSVQNDYANDTQTTEYELQGFDIFYSHDEDGLVNHSVVTASYSARNHQDLQLQFVSDPGEHWYCIQAGTNLIECANDI